MNSRQLTLDRSRSEPVKGSVTVKLSRQLKGEGRAFMLEAKTSLVFLPEFLQPFKILPNFGKCLFESLYQLTGIPLS